MSYLQINENMLAMLFRVEALGALTLPAVVGREPTATDRKEMFRLWFGDMLRVVPGPGEDYETISTPFHYALSDAGALKLEKIREGESTDRFETALEKTRGENEGAEVLVLPDTSSHSTRSLVVVRRGGEVDYQRSRWIYLSGTLRRPEPTDVDTLLEEER